MTGMSRALISVAVTLSFTCGAASAMAKWRLAATRTSSLAYNQGVAFDQARGDFFFDGVSSLTNSGLYRTSSRLRQTAANTALIPQTREGYNHAGDLSFDPFKRRLLLPFECYYPNTGGNTCGTGAIGVADPVTLRLRYYVNLARSQIKKAMWDEIGPDGKWIWTSSGTHLLAYRASDVNPATARRQRNGKRAGILGRDLGAVLPSGSVTGATFYRDPRTHVQWLLLSLNLGTRFEVVAFGAATTRQGLPKLLSSHPHAILTVPQSSLNHEPEGLATTTRTNGNYPLGGALHWQMLPTITLSTLFSRVLTYMP